MRWQADSVQAVLFLQPGNPQPEALALWNTLFAPDGPDSFQRLAQNPSAPTVAAGAREGINIQIASQIGRIDIVAQSVDTVLNSLDANQQMEPTFIDDFEKVTKAVARYAAELSPALRAIRLAVVLSLVMPNDGGAKSMRKVAEIEFPDDATDLLYRFNVRKQMLCAPDVSINRLVTWSINQVHVMMIGPNLAPRTAGREMLNFKIDVNTVQNSIFEQSLIPSMFDELANQTVEIAALGKKAFL